MTDRTAPSSDARKRNAARARDAGDESFNDFIAHVYRWAAPSWRPVTYSTRTHTIDPETGHFTPTDQEPDMTAKTRHDELKALLSKISEESVTTSNVLADLLDLLRERLPERTEVKVAPFDPDLAARNLDALKHAVSKPIEVVTEEPPVGTYLADRDGDVWERREDGWVDWAPEPRTWGYVFEFEEVRTRYAPLRFATPADLARVGIEEPAPADDLPGEPVEPGDLRAGDKVAFTWWGVEHSTCTLVSVAGGSILRADANDAGDRGIPYVVIRGEWAGGISDVRLLERAPREDEDPDEALAKALWTEFYRRWEWTDREIATLSGEAVTHWLATARAAREHIEAERESRERTVVDEWDDMLARAEKAERALDNATQRVLDLTAERDKWNTLAHEADRNAKRHHDRAEKAETERDEWREVAARYADGRDKWQARHEALRADVEACRNASQIEGILARDDERAKKGEQR